MIALCDLDKSVENLFVITKLTLVFPIYPNLEEAIKSL
jgi:anti-anti-sigma regulatory factor